MPWLLLLVVLPGFIALAKSESHTPQNTQAAAVLGGEICVGIALYVAHILGAF
jgi:hypothetical protein